MKVKVAEERERVTARKVTACYTDNSFRSGFRVKTMSTWPEIVNVQTENRHELMLSGESVSRRFSKTGVPDELFSCSGLNFLRVSETCLSEISPKIAMLHNLTSLVLHSNKLTELQAEIGELKKLKLLDASNNQIKVIPDSINKLESLTTLNLSSNQIEVIPDLSNNKWLSVVDLSQNLLTDMSDLCHSSLTHLAEVKLKGNKITSIPAAVKNLVALKLFDVSDNNISEVIGEVGDVPKLKEVHLQGNPLADKRLGKLVLQCKPKQILDYIREHGVRENPDAGNDKGKKKKKGRVKQNSSDGENLESATSCKYKIMVSKSDNGCKIIRTKFTEEVRPHIIACVVKNVALDVDSFKKFISIQTKMHDGICEKRNFATIATHDLDACGGNQFTYTAVSPDALKITPLYKNREYTGKELFTQLQTEADNFRKEKKRNTYSGIHKFLHLLEGKPLYPCLLNPAKTVISFPPLTNSEITKISINTKNILIEVTSSSAQGKCKKVLDILLKEMVTNGIGVTVDDNENSILNVEQVKVEDVDGKLIVVYPSKVDLVYDDSIVEIIRE